MKATRRNSTGLAAIHYSRGSPRNVPEHRFLRYAHPPNFFILTPTIVTCVSGIVERAYEKDIHY